MAAKHLQTKERQACQREHESTRMDDIIKDTIIVSKIKEKDAFKEIEEGLIHDGNLEKEQIAAEYEAIVKKQLQMLQADERGRQALQTEIAEIRSKQEKRAEALKTRAKALEIEKERAKRVANRPPPLPRSVRLLLKEQAKSHLESENKDSTSNICPLEENLEDVFIENSEDKENIDEEYLAEKRKIEEEWDKKAKKRFYEALKKDRQKQEHDAILKDIENAEKLNRRQMARNVSEPTGRVPNYLPDKLHHAEKQVAMEDAVENIFKKKNPKEEHAVEDLEGYQDKWEAKYKQIDSVTESRMVDCVPSFVKENYSYLLQEETTHQCGKRFSGLDDSTDDLNMAYIESPPADILNNSKEIDAVISQLDQMRVELNEAYEKEFKPLLEAAAAPKTVLLDKSVETDILKLPTEDKAIEVERTPPRKQVPSSSRSVQVDILQGGVMSYQRRHLGNMYRSHTNNSDRYLPDSFASQSYTPSEVRSPRGALESWSSSSYWSLPSNHGVPNICKFCDSPGCTIPLVEDEKLHKDCVPLGKSLNKQSVNMSAKSPPATNDSSDELVTERHSPSKELHSSLIKSKLASYIQLVADKYLKKSTTSPEALGSPKEIPRVSEQTPPKAYSKGPAAFSKFKYSENVEISDQTAADTDFAQTSSVSTEQFFRKQSLVVEETSAYDSNKTGQHEYEELCQNMQRSSEYALVTNMNSSSEDELLKKCHAVIAANISDVFSPGNRFETASADVSHSSDESPSPEATTENHYRNESLTGYVYHDLSTIPEMDSALTNETKESSLNETRGSLGNKILPKEADMEDISPDEVDTTSASLVDAPVSEVSEIAKGIRFIRKPTPEPVEKNEASDEHIPLVSGTLSDFQTPKHLMPGFQFLPDDQMSSFSSIMDAKTSDGGSGSYDLLTPSPVSTLKSVSATKSQVFPYSSSLRDSKSSQSPFTSSSALSKYFQDVSSIKHVSEISSKSSGGASTPGQVHVRKQTELHQSSSGTFLPMTPHSYLSTPSEISGKQKDHNAIKRSHLASQKNVLAVFETPDSNTDSFKPLSAHSYFSSGSKITPKHQSLSAKPFSPRKGSQHASRIGVSSQRNIDDRNSDSFKPLSLLSNISTPKDTFMKHKNIILNEKDIEFLNKIKEYPPESAAGSSNFQPMTPHPDFSSINKTTPKHPSTRAKNFSSRKDNQDTSHIGVSSQKYIDDSNSDSFKPLSLLSNVSTPHNSSRRQENIVSHGKDTQLLDKINEEYQYDSSANSNFQPMTPQLYFSSPSDNLPQFSSGKESKEGSVNLRLRIPTPFKNKASSPTQEIEGTSGGPKSVTYPIRLRLDVRDFTNPSKDIENYIVDGSHAQQDLSKSLIEGDLSEGPMSSTGNVDSLNAVKHIAKDEMAVKVSSSGFVPQFRPEDFISFEKNKIKENKEELLAAEMLGSTKDTTDSKVKYFNRFLHSENNAIASSNNKSSLKNSASIINNDLKDLPNVTSSLERERGYSSSSSGEARALSVSPNPILQALAQQLVSSGKLCTPCATPSNGSSENLSEMFAESTPVKSIEEFMLETGILEEPSLTMMNTELTIKPDSPEKSRLFSEGSLRSEDFRTPSTLQSGCFTPNTLDTPSDSASSPYYCDSPSMLSFLKHEQSCLASSGVKEKELPAKKTSHNEYKTRTKRLWNNLEEVQTKKLLEERKEQIRKNRLKMKSYSKKTIIPKKN